jgi:hypothetical protein
MSDNRLPEYLDQMRQAGSMDRYPEFADQHTEIPWRNIRGMRNRIAHGYFDINLDVALDINGRTWHQLLDGTIGLVTKSCI